MKKSTLNPSQTSRREFLRRASALSGTVGAAGLPFAMNLAAMNTAVAQASDYKAIVCLFLYGGNDSANMVLPTDAASWQAYVSARAVGQNPISLSAVGAPVDPLAEWGSPGSLGGVLPIEPNFTAYPVNNSRSFALHPCMPGAKLLFDQGRLAVIANAGPLVQPLTKAEYLGNSKPLPKKLFSHNDQQSTWQALGPEGTKVGWGGRLGDMLASSNSSTVFTSISVSGDAVFLSGDTVFQYQAGSGGSAAIGNISGSLYGSAAAATSYRAIVTNGNSPQSNTHLLAREYATITKRSIDAQAAFQNAYASANVVAPTQYLSPVSHLYNSSEIAAQLRVVARIISSHAALGVNRQVFFVSIGGFDSHGYQSRTQAELLTRLSNGIGYFDSVLGTLGMRDKVTLFTASDFGRTFTSNGDGTDHGWGAHHLVYGGAVKGKDIYGRFPQVGVNHPDEVGAGVFLPGVSVDQIGGTLGQWFGASDAQLDTVFPNLQNFERDLGFMQPG